MPGRERVPSWGTTAPGTLKQNDNGLHAGHDRLGQGPVANIQRARMLAAMAEVASEVGAANVTVAQVVARSGVSRRTFYELFADREDCLLAAVDDALESLSACALPAYGSAGPWRERLRAGLAAALGFFDQQPALGRLLVVETLGAGSATLRRRSAALSHVIAAIDRGHEEIKRSGAQPPPLMAEGLAGAVLSVIQARMLEEDGRPLIELLNPLMSMIVLPYLGAAASRRELTRTLPKHDRRPDPVRSDSLASLRMRLTYRTVRVLTVIAQRPGSSNREVADMADIPDAGQASKLLARLHQLGLLSKTNGNHHRGEPNAWHLTNKGKEIERTITTRI